MGNFSFKNSVTTLSNARLFRFSLAAGASGIALGLNLAGILNPFVLYAAFLVAACCAALTRGNRNACIIFLLTSFLLFGLYRAAYAQEQHAREQPKQAGTYYRAGEMPHVSDSVFVSALQHVRGGILDLIADNLPHVHAQLLGGILVGARGSFPDILRESFNRIGITHIVAVSGYNITILIALLYALCSGLGMKQSHSIWIVVVGIVGFTVLAGASAATVRAALMGGVAVLARCIGRGRRSHTAILIALYVMLVYNPLILFDIGFQLSFSAMLGLVYLAPTVERVAVRIPELFGLKQVMIQTLAAIVATGPLILWYFGTISLIAPIANILVVPLVPFIMATGVLCGAISGIAALFGASFFSLFAPYVWALCWAPLEYIIRISSLLSDMPLASVSIQHPLVVYSLVICFYALLFLVFMKSSRRRLACAVFLLISLFCIGTIPAVHAEGAVSLFLDEQTISRGYRVASEDMRFSITLRPKALKRPARVTIETIASRKDAQDRFPIDPLLEFASDVYVYDIHDSTPSDMRQPLLIEMQPVAITPWTSLYFFDRGSERWKKLASRSITVDMLRAPSPFAFAPIAALQEKKTISGFGLSSLLGRANAILVMDNRNMIVMAKQARLQVRPASITKLMTALVFLDHNPGWKKKITILPSDDAESAHIPFAKKEKVTAHDLFMGMLVGSNNNAAKALARSTGLSEVAFLSAMNAKAVRLKMYHTLFYDTSGLDVRNVSTAEDIMRLANVSFRQKDISAALSVKSYVIKGANRMYSIKTTNVLLESAQGVKGKTGYIDESGYNFVGRAKLGATMATIAVLGAPTSADRFDVIRKLLRLVR